MKATIVVLVAALATLPLLGCQSVPSIPDQTPCTGFIKSGGDCIGKPINTRLRSA